MTTTTQTTAALLDADRDFRIVGHFEDGETFVFVARDGKNRPWLVESRDGYDDATRPDGTTVDLVLASIGNDPVASALAAAVEEYSEALIDGRIAR